MRVVVGGGGCGCGPWAGADARASSFDNERIEHRDGAGPAGAERRRAGAGFGIARHADALRRLDLMEGRIGGATGRLLQGVAFP